MIMANTQAPTQTPSAPPRATTSGPATTAPTSAAPSPTATTTPPPAASLVEKSSASDAAIVQAQQHAESVAERRARQERLWRDEQPATAEVRTVRARVIIAAICIHMYAF